MTVQKLLEEIASVSDEEVACAELSQEMDGVPVGEPIADPFIQRLATLYYRKERALNEMFGGTDPSTLLPEEEHAECVESKKLGVLGSMLDYELERLYGAFVSGEERNQEVILEIQEGWRVHKVLNDVPVAELEDALDEELSNKPSRAGRLIN